MTQHDHPPVPITAPPDRPLYVGSQVVPAGETRVFDHAALPPHMQTPRPTPAPESAPDPVATLLEGTVKDIAAALPALGAYDLERLEQLERAGGNRKGLLSAIDEEQLRRASSDDDAANSDKPTAPPAP